MSRSCGGARAEAGREATGEIAEVEAEAEAVAAAHGPEMLAWLVLGNWGWGETRRRVKCAVQRGEFAAVPGGPLESVVCLCVSVHKYTVQVFA